MASKPETNFIKRVHNALDPLHVYHEKMHNMYRGGTPDVWYSGDLNDLWIEYKWIPKTPKRTPTPKLSELQKEWIGARRSERRRVWVVVGTPGCIYLWTDGPMFLTFKTPAALASEILKITGASTWLSQQSSSLQRVSSKRRTKLLPRASY